jgi:hypothetical protein
MVSISINSNIFAIFKFIFTESNVAAWLVFPVLQRFDEAATIAGVVVTALVAVSHTAFVGCVFCNLPPNYSTLLTLFGFVAEIGP